MINDYFHDVLVAMNILHTKYGLGFSQSARVPADVTAKFRIDSVKEESQEFIEALESGDLVKIAREGIDLIMVIVGTFIVYGIPFWNCWETVFQSNMKKQEASGDRTTKKLIKPQGWVSPDAQLRLDVYTKSPVGAIRTRADRLRDEQGRNEVKEPAKVSTEGITEASLRPEGVMSPVSIQDAPKIAEARARMAKAKGDEDRMIAGGQKGYITRADRIAAEAHAKKKSHAQHLSEQLAEANLAKHLLEQSDRQTADDFGDGISPNRSDDDSTIQPPDTEKPSKTDNSSVAEDDSPIV